MRNCLVSFVVILSLVRLSTSVRDIPKENPGVSDQKTFLPCFPSKIQSNNDVDVVNKREEQTFVHANAPVVAEAESPGGSTGLKDKKNFIYGGVGGFAGMGGYAGVVGGIPVLGGLGGIGKYGGIGGAAGLGGGVGAGGLPGGLPGLPGAGGGGVPGTGAVGATSLGGLPCHP